LAEQGTVTISHMLLLPMDTVFLINLALCES